MSWNEKKKIAERERERKRDRRNQVVRRRVFSGREKKFRPRWSPKVEPVVFWCEERTESPVFKVSYCWFLLLCIPSSERILESFG